MIKAALFNRAFDGAFAPEVESTGLTRRRGRASVWTVVRPAGTLELTIRVNPKASALPFSPGEFSLVWRWDEGRKVSTDDGTVSQLSIRHRRGSRGVAGAQRRRSRSSGAAPRRTSRPSGGTRRAPCRPARRTRGPAGSQSPPLRPLLPRRSRRRILGSLARRRDGRVARAVRRGARDSHRLVLAGPLEGPPQALGGVRRTPSVATRPPARTPATRGRQTPSAPSSRGDTPPGPRPVPGRNRPTRSRARVCSR